MKEPVEPARQVQPKKWIVLGTVAATGLATADVNADGVGLPGAGCKAESARLRVIRGAAQRDVGIPWRRPDDQ